MEKMRVAALSPTAQPGDKEHNLASARRGRTSGGEWRGAPAQRARVSRGGAQP